MDSPRGRRAGEDAREEKSTDSVGSGRLRRGYDVDISSRRAPLRYRRLQKKWFRHDCCRKIQRLARIYVARHALARLVRRRKAAGFVLTRSARGFLARCKVSAWRDALKRYAAGVAIQRIYRGVRARKRWLLLTNPEAIAEAEIVAERERQEAVAAAEAEAERLRLLAAPAPAPGAPGYAMGGFPMAEGAPGFYGEGPGGGWPPPKVYTNYWEAREDYMAQQEALVGEAVQVLQRSGLFFCWRARRYAGAVRIQALYRVLKERRLLHKLQEAVRLEQLKHQTITALQAIRRGQLGRAKYANRLRDKRRAAAFRKKRKLAALTIQARARGVICREGIRRQLRDEARKLAASQQAFRDNAAMTIQCAQRQKVARVVARKRRQEQRAEEEAREKDRELELALDQLKLEQETNLYAMRIQCCYRTRIARRRLEAQMQALVDEERNLKEKKRFDAVAKIQARARGNVGRAEFAKNRKKLEDSKTIRNALNRMKARQTAEINKVEARMRHLDKFGPSEYLWAGVRGELGDAAPPAAGAEEDGESEGVEAPSGEMPGGDWVQQWDESARANYWYNASTGEASWTEPAAPAALPAPTDWVPQFDESAQANYWYNNKTGEASWVDPAAAG